MMLPLKSWFWPQNNCLLYMTYFDKGLKIILNTGKDSALYSDRVS